MSVQKVGRFTVKQVGPETDRVLRFIGTDESEDRDGDIIMSSGWDFSAYKANPVFLWGHNYDVPSLGKCIGIQQAPGTTGTSFDIKFASIPELSPENPDHPSEHAKFVETIYRSFQNGYLNAVSVGFVGKKFETRDDQDDKPNWMRGSVFTEQELLELSAVTVPSNRNALIQARRAKSMKPDELQILEKIFTESKGAIPYKKYPLAPEDETWDAGAVVREADTNDLKLICTWYDSSKSAEDLTKGDFKLPHHLGSADGHKTVWAGVKAAMGALLGSRGGVDIPEADKEACYNHLKKHYAEFEKDAPDFKAYTAAELKSMFEEENEMDEKAVQKMVSDAVKPLLAQIEELKSVKGGAKYSAETKAKMQEAHDHVMKGIEVLKGMISDSGTVGTEPGDDSGVERPEPNVDERGIDLAKVDLKKYGLGA